MTDETKRYRANPAIKWKAHLKGVVTDNGVAMNETAALLFVSLSEEATSLAALCDRLADQKGWDRREFLNDAKAVVGEMLDDGLVIEAGADTADLKAR
ncbi:MAG: PqqD family peptide modification chaperone [Rhizomicrobium sp.]